MSIGKFSSISMFTFLPVCSLFFLEQIKEAISSKIFRLVHIFWRYCIPMKGRKYDRKFQHRNIAYVSVWWIGTTRCNWPLNLFHRFRQSKTRISQYDSAQLNEEIISNWPSPSEVFTFISVSIMNNDIRILSALSLGVPVFVCILSALKCGRNADRNYRHKSKKCQHLQFYLVISSKNRKSWW
mgnify:CR=1 FL=1